MKAITYILITIWVALQSVCYCQSTPQYPSALVSMDDYESVQAEAKELRKDRLISYDELKCMKEESNTVILDARSRINFNAKHLKGAINLPFTEFTVNNLRALIPDTSTQIIIYCNNNFIGDQVFFASKIAPPKNRKARKVKGLIPTIGLSQRGSESVMLALNIPTYINLYGYGYPNVYELNELVDLTDSRLELNGYTVSPRVQ